MLSLGILESGGGATTRVMDAIRIDTSTGAGTRSYTSSALTGTPAGALVVGSFHLAANGTAETPYAIVSIGSLVGSSGNSIGASSRDNQTSSVSTRFSSSSSPLYFESAGGGIEIKTSSASAASGGVSLTFSTAGNDRRCMAAAFGGAGTQAKNGIIPLGTGTSAINVTGVGFQPDVVFLYGNNDDFAGGQTNLYQYTFGITTSDLTQRSICGVEIHNVAAGGNPFLALLTDCGASSNSANGTVTKLTVGGFNSDGFTITPSTSQGSDDLGYLALKFSGHAVKLVDFTTPTSTGNQAITGAGFTPQFAIVVLTSLETTDSASAITNDLQSGASISFIGDSHHSVSWRLDSGADPTDTATLCTSDALLGATATACDTIKASLASFDSDGMTLNYSAVAGTGKKGFILFVE